jgi:hypothetical protein
MGVGSNGLQFALLAKRLGTNFERTITLGRQHHFLNATALRSTFARFKVPLTHAEEKEVLQNAYAENLFKKLGATLVDSADASTYEGASIIHDFNKPIDASLVRSYTCVIDFGSLEHVFNVAVALKNCTDMIEIGGHFLGMSPANNMMGHGFYQFSPELYFNYLSHNGFADIDVFMIPYRAFQHLFHVTDPRDIRDRVEFVNAEPVMIAVIAKKIEHLETARIPIQSDYQDTLWQGRVVNRQVRPAKSESQIAAAVRNMREQIASLTAWPETLSPNFVLGFENPRHYQLIDPVNCQLRSGGMNIPSADSGEAWRDSAAIVPDEYDDDIQKETAADGPDPHAGDALKETTGGMPQVIEGFECIKKRGVLIPMVPSFSPGPTKKPAEVSQQEERERRQAKLLDELIQNSEVILEIGSGSGFISTYCAMNPHAKQVFCVRDNPNIVEEIKLTHRINHVNVTVLNEMLGNVNDGPKLYERSDLWASRDDSFLGTTIEVQTQSWQSRLDQVRPTMLIIEIKGEDGLIFEDLDLAGVKKIMVALHQSTMARRWLKQLFDILSAKDFHYDSWHSSHSVVTFSHVDRN